MEFRWVMGIVLWTLLSGPILAPTGKVASRTKTPAAKTNDGSLHTAKSSP